MKKAAKHSKWLHESLMNFILYQKERVNRKEICEGTIGNYYKAIKLFCEMNFDRSLINWKKIARGLPRARKFALDRIPSNEEIRKLCSIQIVALTLSFTKRFRQEFARGLLIFAMKMFLQNDLNARLSLPN